MNQQNISLHEIKNDQFIYVTTITGTIFQSQALKNFLPLVKIAKPSQTENRDSSSNNSYRSFNL